MATLLSPSSRLPSPRKTEAVWAAGDPDTLLPSPPARLPADLAGELGRILRFGCVGATGVVVNFGALWLLTEHAALYYLTASIIATEAAIASNFVLNHLWTFRALRDGEPAVVKFLKYNTLALGGMALSLAVLWLLTHLAGVHYLAANVVAVGASMGWNYLTNRRWTWSIRHNASDDPARDACDDHATAPAGAFSRSLRALSTGSPVAAPVTVPAQVHASRGAARLMGRVHGHID